MSEISLKNVRSVIVKLTEIQVIKKKNTGLQCLNKQTLLWKYVENRFLNFIVFPAYTKPLIFGVSCTRDPNYSFLSVAYSQ